MIRAVLDPGVLIAGALSGTGAPAKLLRWLEMGAFDLIVCPHLLEELRCVFTYRKIRKRIAGAEAAGFLEILELIAVHVSDPTDVPPACRDPNDDYLFALAGEHADVLVSGDRDVLGATDPLVRVLSPAGFAEILGRRSD